MVRVSTSADVESLYICVYSASTRTLKITVWHCVHVWQYCFSWLLILHRFYFYHWLYFVNIHVSILYLTSSICGHLSGKPQNILRTKITRNVLCHIYCIYTIHEQIVCPYFAVKNNPDHVSLQMLNISTSMEKNKWTLPMQMLIPTTDIITLERKKVATVK